VRRGSYIARHGIEMIARLELIAEDGRVSERTRKKAVGLLKAISLIFERPPVNQ
jgi:hypothetical protein